MVLGAQGAAAPIRNAAGRAIAAIVAIGLTWRFHPNLGAHLHDVTEAAQDLSDALVGGPSSVASARHNHSRKGRGA